MKRVLAVVGLGALVAIALGVASPALTELAAGGDGQAPKVFVCKYVGKPGVDEVLKEGKQPISVSSNATVGTWFNDAQGRSFVLAIDDGEHEYDWSDCPVVTNDKGELIVEKVVVNNDGGTKVASDFSFTVNGQQHAFDADGSVSFVVDPGTYAVAEVAAEGYTSSGGGSVDIAAGETKTVTITNDDVKGEEPVDVCPNIEGDQATVPEGLVQDAEGNCVEPKPPVDVCPNIEGDQATVPEGLVQDVHGNCVTPTPETTPTETTATQTETTLVETTPTETTPVETTPVETTPVETTPTAPLTPPTTTKKPVEKKAPAKAKPAPLTPPKKAVAGVQKQAAAQAKAQPKLAYTP